MKFVEPKNKIDKLFHEKLLTYVEELLYLSWDYIGRKENDLKMIYGLGTMEQGIYTFDTFFNIKNQIFEIHEFEGKEFDDENEVQELGIAIIKKIVNHFNSNKRDLPTQLKIEYSNISKKVEFDFEYDLFWSIKEDSLPDMVYNNWIEQIQNNLINTN